MLTVFVNKLLLSSDYFRLDAPLFVTWSQCVVSTCICFTMGRISKLKPDLISFPSGNPTEKSNIQNVRDRFVICRVFLLFLYFQVLPLAILFTAMIASNNLCLKYVGVAFYYVGRSLTTVFNVVFSFVLLGERTSLPCIVCCAVIIGGFGLGVDQESITSKVVYRI